MDIKDIEKLKDNKLEDYRKRKVFILDKVNQEVEFDFEKMRYALMLDYNVEHKVNMLNIMLPNLDEKKMLNITKKIEKLLTNELYPKEKIKKELLQEYINVAKQIEILRRKKFGDSGKEKTNNDYLRWGNTIRIAIESKKYKYNNIDITLEDINKAILFASHKDNGFRIESGISLIKKLDNLFDNMNKNNIIYNKKDKDTFVSNDNDFFKEDIYKEGLY